PLDVLYRRVFGYVMMRARSNAKIVYKEQEADQAEHKRQAHGPGRHESCRPSRRVAAQGRIHRCSQSCLTLGTQKAPQRPNQKEERKRGQRQQRGHDIQHARMLAEPGHDYPFSSSAVSTSTVMWLL